METRWIDGNDLLSHLNRGELFEAVKSGELTPYDRDDGKKIIDYETLLVCTETGKGISQWRMPTEREVDENIPIDSKPSFLTRENITGFIYLVDQIESLSEKLKVPSLDASGTVTTSKESIDQRTPEKQPLQEKKPPTNSIYRDGEKHWRITYLDEKGIVNDYKYIRYLLWILIQKDLSAVDIISYSNGYDTVSKDKIPEGLSLCKNYKERKVSNRYIKDINRLKAELDDETDLLVKRDLESEYDEKINLIIKISSAESQNLGKPSDKKEQSLVRKGLEKAYKLLEKEGLKKMAKHLRPNIDTNRQYGFWYKAVDTTWDINLEK